MRRSEYLAFLDAKFEKEFGPKLEKLREINRLAAIGLISERERLKRHEKLFPGFSKVESAFHLANAAVRVPIAIEA